MIFSSRTPHSQYALTHFRSPRCSWWAGPPSSQASPSPPPRRRQRWWWWSRRGGGRGGGTSLLSSFWRTLFSSVDKEGVSVIESCGRGSFKGGEVFIGLATGLTSQGLLSPLSYLLPGNSEECALPRSSGKYWVTSSQVRSKVFRVEFTQGCKCLGAHVQSYIKCSSCNLTTAIPLCFLFYSPVVFQHCLFIVSGKNTCEMSLTFHSSEDTAFSCQETFI